MRSRGPKPFDHPGPQTSSLGGWIGCAAGPALITTAHLAYGTTTRLASLVLVMAVAGLLLTLLAFPTHRRRLARRSFVVEGAAFMVAIAVAVWSMTPFVPGGPDPVWRFGGTVGASTIDLSATGLEIVKLLGLACFFLIGAIQGTDPQGRRRSLVAMLAFGALMTALFMADFLTDTRVGAQTGRLTGFFPSANVAGTVMAALLVLSATWFVGRWTEPPPPRAGDRWVRLAPPAALSLIFTSSLAATGSRGAFAAAAIALALLVGLVVSNPGTRRGTSLCVLMLVAVLVLAGGGLILDRLTPAALMQDQRPIIFETHWRAFLASPLMGYGLGTFSEVNRQLLNADTYAALWSINAAHNLYLQWLEEAGLIGALPMAIAVGAPMIRAAPEVFRRPSSGTWTIGPWLMLIVFLVHGLTDFSLQVYSVAAMFAFLLGLQREPHATDQVVQRNT